MSAFTVTRETINCVLHAVYPEQLPAEQFDILGQELWKMNCDAVNARYTESNPLEEVFRWTPRHYSKIQQLKSLHCLIYQCTEGDVPERDLYKLLVKKANELAYDIISHTPEFDKAAWDLPSR